MPSTAPPGQFTVLYFASASSYTGKTSDTLSAPIPISELFNVLDERYPGFMERVLGSCAVTVNLDYVDLDSASREVDDAEVTVIQEGDEVAIIPPVSSG